MDAAAAAKRETAAAAKRETAAAAETAAEAKRHAEDTDDKNDRSL